MVVVSEVVVVVPVRERPSLVVVRFYAARTWVHVVVMVGLPQPSVVVWLHVFFRICLWPCSKLRELNA